MKIFAASAFVLLVLCGPALADPPRHASPAPPALPVPPGSPASPASPAPSIPPAPPTSLNIRFVVHTGAATRTHDVIVAGDRRCASVSEKVPDHLDEITVCTSEDSHLDIDWFTHASSSEYRSKASVVLAHGATAELGSGSGPRLGVTIR